ncbi:hypothetical protein AB3S75_013385 [Citrus x aurantiifolia]
MIFLSKSSTKVVKRGRKCGETSEVGTSKGEDHEEDDDHKESLTLSNQRFTRNYSRHAAMQAEIEQASSVPPFALKTRFKQINGALSASSATTDGLHVHKEVVVMSEHWKQQHTMCFHVVNKHSYGQLHLRKQCRNGQNQCTSLPVLSLMPSYQMALISVQQQLEIQSVKVRECAIDLK